MTWSRRRVGTLAAEAVMVLFGVLGAFTLEGWRNEREVAREVRQELVSVQGELHRNRDAVAVEIQSLQRVVAGGDALVAKLDRAQIGAVLSVPDTLLFLAAVWNPTYDAPLGAVQALLASGRLAEIRDPRLRLGLAGLDEVVVDAREEQEFARLVTTDDLAPVLDEAITWPTFQLIFSDFFGASGEGASPQDQAASRPVPAYESVELITSRSLRNTIVRRVIWQRAAIGEFRRLEARIDDLVRLVEQELES